MKDRNLSHSSESPKESPKARKNRRRNFVREISRKPRKLQLVWVQDVGLVKVVVGFNQL